MFRLATYPLRILRALLHRFMPVACYIMWEKDLFLGLIPIGPHRFKIGISREPVKRNAEIKSQLHDGVRLVFWLPMPFAYKFEQGVLHATRFASVEMPKHAGRTEWRQWYNVVSATIAGLAAYAYGGDVAAVWCVVALLALPLDIFMIFLALAAFWYAVAAAVLFGLGWVLLNILI